MDHSGYGQANTVRDPKATSLLEALAERLSAIMHDLREVAARMEQAADRAVGPEPQKATADERGATIPKATLGTLMSNMDDLGSIRNYLQVQMARIERIM